MRPSNAFEPLREPDLEQPLPRRFEAQVERGPERPAISTDADEISYAALDAWAERIAAGILARIGPEPLPVAICFHQDPQSIAAILGALKARKFWVPLDPRAPVEHGAHVLGECGAELMLSDRANGARARELALGRRLALLDVEAFRSGSGSGERVELAISPDDLAYVFYTSGSTGRPKGVCDTHRNVTHNVLRYTNSLHLCRDDRLTLIQACSFSGTVSSLFGALLNGACVLPFDFAGASPAQLADWLERSRPTVYHSVPAIFRSLFSAGPRSFPGLRVIRLEGDAASARDLELYRRHLPGCVLVNGLGTTETGLIAQYFAAPSGRGGDERGEAAVVPVGRAVEGIALQVVDARGQPCPTGEVGEIAVSGRHLAPGYWGRPELTRERFRADPQAGPGMRTYLSGDLGRFRADGCLEHLGRIDARAKIHGQWVELADVEAQLQALDGVKEAAVATVADGLETRLVAYLVASRDPAPSAASLRRTLEERLPLASIPHRFVWLDALPRSTAGKLDRGALPRREAREPGRTLLEPRNLVELRLAQLWERILETGAIGARDDFFELGGDSLGALLLVDAVEADFGRRIPPSVLLEARTVEALAEVLRSGAPLQPIVPMRSGNGGVPFHFLHGDYLGGGLYCHALVRELGEDVPFFALTPCGVGGDPLPPSYEAMARRHLELLRARGHAGPWRLGGNCNGGLVAFELARLLEAEGERVERLVLISASAANRRFAPLRGAVDLIGRAAGAAPDARLALFRRMRELALRLEPLAPGERARTVLRSAAKWPGALGDLVLRGRAGAEVVAGNERDRGYLRQRYHEIDAEYVPRRCAGPVWLIWPESDPEPAELAARRWRELSPSVSLRRVPGTHTTCLTEHVGLLAREIRACLE